MNKKKYNTIFSNNRHAEPFDKSQDRLSRSISPFDRVHPEQSRKAQGDLSQNHKTIRSNRKQCGYSILELILVIVLIGIIAGILARMFLWGMDIFNFVSDRKDVVQTSRIGMKILSKDLRSLQSTDDIVSASSSELEFYNPDDEEIVFSYSSGTVSRNSNSMIEDLSSFLFTYYEVDGDTIATPVEDVSDIWKIKYTLNATVGGNPVHMESSVIPRRF
jgi:prepilin-type N-terminal cleavage/methylation domain-containing protein